MSRLTDRETKSMAQGKTQENESQQYVWPKEGISRVPYWIYSDPKIYEKEQEVIFSGPSYSYVGLEAEIPKPGDFRRTTIGDKPVVVARDMEGGINVVVNRCAHRGVEFCYKGPRKQR